MASKTNSITIRLDMNQQLELKFDNSEFAIQDLISAFNFGRKNKYLLDLIIDISGMILIAIKYENDILFNIIDESGKCPLNMSSDWRVKQLIINDLNKLN